jgi:hypothetical protein
MLQTWNKFCYTEGVLEMSAQLPGIATQGGLWPALWIMGNLGRATAQKSTDKIWPFSYSHCPSEAEARANQFPAEQQEINACRSKNWTDEYGLNVGQGRGAIEIDIVEAMPGNWTFAYKEWKVDKGFCPPLPEDQYTLLESPRPMVATSLQLAPGIPFASAQRPLENNIRFGGSQGYNCVPSDWNNQWYPELKQGNSSTYGTVYKSQPNVDFWGEYFKGSGEKAIDLQTDSLSSLNSLPKEAWEGQHTYRLDWRAGRDGYVEFRMDGEKQFRVNSSSVFREHDITTESGNPIGKLLGRQMPEEPSYIMLNIDLSTRWGWPDCDTNYCDCCSDCRDPKCTTCYYPWQPEANQRQWLAELCKTLPAWYEIDYVRLWQRRGNTRTSCSPKDYPTQGWIESHRERYILPNMNEPLRPVLAGGYRCNSDSECGEGSCIDEVCACARDWTGPRCLVKRAGASAICHALEAKAVGGAACFTNSPADCGKLRNHGVCVEVARPGGKYTPNQTYQISSDRWEKVGGGDGRCKCKDGWGGVSCSIALPNNSCTPQIPNPTWMGADLEQFIEETCSNNESDGKYTLDVAQACEDVLWKPHWKQGGSLSGCGAWLRASWVARAASCGINVAADQSDDDDQVEIWTYVAIGIGVLSVLAIALSLWMCRRPISCRLHGKKNRVGDRAQATIEEGATTVTI